MASVRNIGRLAVATAAVTMGLTTMAAPASADTANTAVGRLTATQTGCNDGGALIEVTVSGGYASTAYTATYTGLIPSSDSFTTDATGAGITGFGNVYPSGWVTVTAAGHTGQVWANVWCPGGKGD